MVSRYSMMASIFSTEGLRFKSAYFLDTVLIMPAHPIFSTIFSTNLSGVLSKMWKK